jgi:hypothetical protein
MSLSGAATGFRQKVHTDPCFSLRRGETAGTESSTGEFPASAGTRQAGELRRRLRELARQVNVADPHSLADARVPVLREILLWEFGSDFRSDSQFLPMVDAIKTALDADPGFQQRFVELVAGLQKG